MKRIALFGFLIHAGVIAATLSSAMASFLGAPRILQSLAGDRVFPFLLPFAKGYGTAGNPRRGVLPDYPVAARPEDLHARRDAVLKYALGLRGGSR